MSKWHKTKVEKEYMNVESKTQFSDASIPTEFVLFFIHIELALHSEVQHTRIAYRFYNHHFLFRNSYTWLTTTTPIESADHTYPPLFTVCIPFCS